MPHQQACCDSDNQVCTPYTTRRYVRFEDCDPSGIVFFPNYFRMLNSVVEDWWNHLGIPWTTLITTRRIGTPTFRLDTEFHHPSHFGETLDFRLEVEKLGKTSLMLRHHVTGNGVLRLQAAQVLVATSLDTHKSTPWPDDVRAAILTFIGHEIGHDHAPSPVTPCDSATDQATN